MHCDMLAHRAHGAVEKPSPYQPLGQTQVKSAAVVMGFVVHAPGVSGSTAALFAAHLEAQVAHVPLRAS